MKVHKGDTVLVIAGKDKGAKGKVIQAYPTRNKVLVEGVNRIKKHTAISTNQRGAQSGGIVTQEAAIHVSNVMVVDSDGKPTRIGYRVDEETGKRAVGVPRDRRGQHRPDPRHGHHRRHLGDERRRRTSVAARPRLSVQGELTIWRRKH
jgi:large subunit ribosomal protein L24